MLRKQYVASTRIDKHNSIMTLEALEGMADQLNNDSRKPILGVQHDRTVPPLGVMVSAQIHLAEDGHHELFAEYELFPDPVPITLPDESEAFHQCSENNHFAFATASMQSSEKITIATDYMNFESHDQVTQFYSELQETLDHQIDEKIFGRKALLNDPEIVFTLSIKAAAIWLAVRAGTGIASSVSDITKEEIKNIYAVIRTSILKYARYARPKQRTTTYVLQIPGKPNLEFVARSTDPHIIIAAFTNDSISLARLQIDNLNSAMSPEYVQFILSENGEWRFNYLLTKDGSAIGTKEAYNRRSVLLNELSQKIDRSGDSNIKHKTT